MVTLFHIEQKNVAFYFGWVVAMLFLLDNTWNSILAASLSDFSIRMNFDRFFLMQDARGNSNERNFFWTSKMATENCHQSKSSKSRARSQNSSWLRISTWWRPMWGEKTLNNMSMLELVDSFKAINMFCILFDWKPLWNGQIKWTKRNQLSRMTNRLYRLKETSFK